MHQGGGVGEAGHEGIRRIFGCRRWCGNLRGNPRVEGVGKADPEIKSQRACQAIGDHLAHAYARDPFENFAGEPAIRDGVITVRRARLPIWSLRGQGGNDRIPGENIVQVERPVDGGEAGAMAEEPANRNLPFAFGGKLGPVLADRGVEVELALLGEDVRRDRDHALGGGDDHLQGVAGVGVRTARLCYAAPKVNDHAAVTVNAKRSADLAVAVEVGDEGITDGLKARVHKPSDWTFDHRSPSRKITTAVSAREIS